MYNEDYLCPVYENHLISAHGELYCEDYGNIFEPWECVNTLKTLEEDHREQKAIDRFYGLED